MLLYQHDTGTLAASVLDFDVLSISNMSPISEMVCLLNFRFSLIQFD